eukprot:gene34702-42803_t
MYIADWGHKVRIVLKSTGLIYTFLGSGSPGFLDGPASSALINKPFQVFGDTVNNNLYIADYGNNRLRVLNWNTAIITTLAGTGVSSSTGSGGAVSSATLQGPGGVYRDSVTGTIYFAENGSGFIRQITTDGIILTVISVGQILGTMQIWADTLNYIYVANNNVKSLIRMHKTTLVTTSINLKNIYSMNGNGTSMQLLAGAGGGLLSTNPLLSNGDGGPPTSATFKY